MQVRTRRQQLSQQHGFQSLQTLKFETIERRMKKRRTKSFTGCWTCRSRRVKCDEETPICQRCLQMGIVCEGYGIRLNWLQYNPHEVADVVYDGHWDGSQQPERKAFRRSLTSFGALPPVPRLNSPEMDVALSTIDEWCPGDSSEFEKGVFSVFSVDSSAPVHSETDTGRLLQLTPHPSEIAVPIDTSETHDISSGIETTIDHDETGTDDVAAQPMNGSHDDSMPAAQTLLSLGRQHQHAPRHLDALSMPSNQKRLIHHWITFTSRKLVLIDEPHNPCRTMMLPMALKGLVAQSSSSNADVAIFHALCASAAYNLFELTGGTNEQDRVLALYHDSKAVHHLRHNLIRADEHRDQSFAMAIMACIVVEAVSGTTQRWRTHVSGGLAYLAKLQSQGLDEAELSAFRQHMVKLAILCGFPVPDELKSFLYDESGSSDGLEFTFPYYGVSRRFLRAHDQINCLLAKEPAVRTPEQERQLDSFELQLYLDFPSLPPTDLLSTATNKTHGIVVHHTSKAFYYAGLVFFQRSVRHVPISAVQDLVELGVQELESIDRAGQGALGCLMLWPVLVLGAECGAPDVQQRMRAWLQAQRRLGFRNLIVLEDLITTVWRAKANFGSAERDIDWQRIIAQPRFDVFRL